MFAPPPIIETEVFATLPARYRKYGQRCAWGEANNRQQATDCFLEGPSFDRAGNLYLVDIPYGRIFRVDAAGRFELIVEYDGWPNGLKIHRDGRLFVADYKRGLLVLDPATGTINDLLTARHTEGFKGLNDLVFASNGDLYFTDQGQTGLHDPTGRVFRLSAQGRLELLLDTVPSPNGVVLNAAENLLYVAVTRGNCIWRAPIMPDGTLSKVGIFVQMSGGIGPDGLATDAAGNLAVAHTGMGGAWLFSEKGIPVGFVRSCGTELTTNLAYGGESGRDLFLIDSGSGAILKARMPAPGTPMFSHS